MNCVRLLQEAADNLLVGGCSELVRLACFSSAVKLATDRQGPKIQPGGSSRKAARLHAENSCARAGARFPLGEAGRGKEVVGRRQELNGGCVSAAHPAENER